MKILYILIMGIASWGMVYWIVNLVTKDPLTNKDYEVIWHITLVSVFFFTIYVLIQPDSKKKKQ